MNPIKLESFNFWIGHAMRDLSGLPDRDARFAREIRIGAVLASLRHALRRANEMRDATRKALCLRVMSWLRAEMRRAA